MKLHCHGVPTATVTNQTTLATTTTTDDTTSLDKLMALNEGNDRESLYNKSEMHERPRTTTTTGTSMRKEDTVTATTTTYDQHAYVTNSSIDIALTPMMR